MKSFLTTLLFLLSFRCLAQPSKMLKYAEDKSISNKHGKPKTSRTSYFPAITYKDSTHYYTYFDTSTKLESQAFAGCGNTKETIKKQRLISIDQIRDRNVVAIDSTLLNYDSYSLLSMDEPILYNYFIGEETYRFTWLRHSTSHKDKPVVIKVEKRNDSIYITSKMLQFRIDDPYNDFFDYETEQFIPFQKRSFTVNTKKTLSIENFNALLSLIDSSKIITTPYIPYCGYGAEIGSGYIFEIADKNGYYVTHRSNPCYGSPLRQIAAFLISVSDLHKVY